MMFIERGLEELMTSLRRSFSTVILTIDLAVKSYLENNPRVDEVMGMSRELEKVHNEIVDRAFELTVRYQPVASDLRRIRSCMEISYGFMRFGRYAKDIVEVLRDFGELNCDKEPVEKAWKITREMVEKSFESFESVDEDLAREVAEMDDDVDGIYSSYLKKAISGEESTKCALAVTLILRYLERMADHAVQIADKTIYVKTGEYGTLK
ncbi:MAG: phosphate uptake regulator, PhoU [Thermoproteota archaeon]|nr:MAG: phosphate uptake regulator, PhoU [Candidatus Korarchaeota archaeon]